VGETLNGYIKLPSGRIHRVLGVVTNSATASIKGKYEIFDHSCENEIAGFMAMEPGQGLVGTPRYNGRFTRDFLESLKHPIIVSQDDTPEDAALKRAVIQAKIDLKDAYDRGEDIEQIMLDTRKEMQDLARYKQELTQQLHEMVKGDSEMTTEEMEDLVEAANQMLDAKGIAPMKFGPLTRRKIMLMREQQLNEGN
jgi:predicted component of type VI protein secretion system